MQEQFQRAMERARKEVARFEGYLSDGREFLAGGMFTIADIYLATAAFYAQRVGATFEMYPNLVKYVARMSERPCFKDTWPSGWLNTPGTDWLAGL